MFQLWDSQALALSLSLHGVHSHEFPLVTFESSKVLSDLIISLQLRVLRAITDAFRGIYVGYLSPVVSDATVCSTSGTNLP
jgi:hypothetical protein